MSRQEHFDVGAGYRIEAEVRPPNEYNDYPRTEVHVYHQDQVVGQLYADHLQHPDDPKRVVQHVEELNLDKQHQGRGIGQAMYDAAHKTARLPFLHVEEEQSEQGRQASQRAAQRRPEAHEFRRSWFD